MVSTTNPPVVVDVIESKAIQHPKKLKLKSVASWFSAHWIPILAEFLSTTMLLLFGCMTNIPIDGLHEQSTVYAPLGYGLIVMINVQIFGHLSGAYMNPAVTLSSIIWGNTSIALGMCYIIAQILGATIGYGMLVGLAPMDVAGHGICVPMPHPALSILQVLIIETVLTMVLSFVCCSLWDPVNMHNQDSAPIKFGLVIVGLSLAGGPLTGASTNPARTLGPAIWTGMWNVHWIYWVGPFIGAALSATLYKFVFFIRFKKLNY